MPRALSRPLLRLRPLVVTRERALVSRHTDVCEVLARDEDFTIAEVNAARMAVVNGPFILGMDRSALYLHERGLLERCVEMGDRERVRTTVRDLAAEAVAAAAPFGRLDVVQQLARPVAAGLVASYFGVAGPVPITMLRWMRALFHETFLNIRSIPAGRKVHVVPLAAMFDPQVFPQLGEFRAEHPGRGRITYDGPFPDRLVVSFRGGG